MKKFYSIVLITLGFLFVTGLARAQYPGGTYETVSAGGDIDNPATWLGGVIPPAGNCADCLILLHGTVNINVSIYVSGTSKIVVEPGGTVNVNQVVDLDNNTQLLVGGGATVYINDEFNLYSNAQVILADVGATLDVNNQAGHSPWGANAAIYGPGLYYWDVTPDIYYSVINQYGYGNTAALDGDPTAYFVYSQYNINCDVPPNDCRTGVVHGPARMNFDNVAPGVNIWQFDAAPPTPLPVNLVQFAASINSDKTVLLSWSTAQETNSDYFELQRSADGNNFQPIGKVKAKGFSTITTNYSYTDANPLNSVNYYRLKMVDQDTKFEFSKVIKVTLDGKTAPLVVYNNPFNDQIRIKLNTSASDNLNLILTDVQGKTYLRQSYKAQPGDNFINIYPPAAASGLYILSIKGSRVSQTVKLLKQ